MDGVHPRARECATDSATVHKVTRSIPRSVTPGGTNNGNDMCSFALDAGVANLPQLNKAEAYHDANNVFLSLQNHWQLRLATEVAGQDSHELTPCP